MINVSIFCKKKGSMSDNCPVGKGALLCEEFDNCVRLVIIEADKKIGKPATKEDIEELKNELIKEMTRKTI